MNLVSPAFFGFVAVTIIAYHAFVSVPWRRIVLMVANGVFIASYLDKVTEVLPLFGFLALGYGGLHIVRLRRGGATLALVILTIVAAYVFLKRFSFLHGVAELPFPYLIIGLSYILFRIIQVIVDAGSADPAEAILMSDIGPLAFFRYTCNFLCFVSGPIQRYQDFAAMDGIDISPLSDEVVYKAFSRVVAGYVKFVVLAASANYVYIHLSTQLIGSQAFEMASAGLPRFCAMNVLCAASYTIYLYFNFSGYMDIVIGIGLLLGQVLPENFDRPFAARSFLEFWQRWHMTLSNWFKLYLFNPLLMQLMTWFPAPGLSQYIGIVAFFVTFLVMGVWHGTTVVFVVYGLLMGAGASVNKVWQLACAKRLGKKRYRLVSQTTAYIYFARGLTVGYFALALTCLWVPDPPQFFALAARLGLPGEVASLLLLSLGFAAASFAVDTVRALVARRKYSLRALSTGLFTRNFTLALRILAIMAINSLFNKAPDFVYKAF